MTTETTKPTVLIVEDEAGPRDALKVILRPFYTIHAADCGQTAQRLLKENPVDLVTLDQKLPDCQGIELLQQIKLDHPNVEVIIITGYGSLKSAMEGIRHGAAGYLLKPFNVTELISLINQTLDKKTRLDGLRSFLHAHGDAWASEEKAGEIWKELSEQHLPAAKTSPEVVTQGVHGPELFPLFSDLLEARDRQLLNHASRTSFYATLIATPLNLPQEQLKSLSLGAFLHDIGYLAFEDQGGHANGELPRSRGQQDVIKRHAEMGARMMLPLGFPAEVGQVISYHHERHDGTGLPLGLHGDGIPLLARIVSIAHTFDNLLTGRGRTGPLSVDEAIKRIEGESGKTFDPALVTTFVKVMSECKASLPALGISPNRAAI